MIFFVISVLIIVAIFIFFASEIRSVQERDPSAKNPLEIVLLYSGLHAIVLYRIANYLHRVQLPFIPRAISQLARFLTGIEIHPAAQIGRGFFIDHGMGVVIGETTIIGNNVTLFQGATLGGTGKECGKRHPTIGNNVVVGAGAKVLGNIIIGDNTYIGANAVVLKTVPANSTVVGVPGHVTKQDGKRIDIQLDHVKVLDPMMNNMTKLLRRIKYLEDKLGAKADVEPLEDPTQEDER